MIPYLAEAILSDKKNIWFVLLLVVQTFFLGVKTKIVVKTMNDKPIKWIDFLLIKKNKGNRQRDVNDKSFVIILLDKKVYCERSEFSIFVKKKINLVFLLIQN